MKLAVPIVAATTALPFASSTIITAYQNITLPTANTTLLGNVYNHWIYLGNDTYDLTRSMVAPTTKPVTIPMTGARKRAVIEPSRSALVIIDMQNFFLHPELTPSAEGGRKAVEPTLKMIDAFRRNSMPVLWTFWGLDGKDLRDLPPADIAGFSNTKHSPTDSFGSDMGKLDDGTELGEMLMRGSWNARPYGPLYDAQIQGVNNGTDHYFNKNRVSGMWGAQTPLGLWLEENQITTLFFGGVNSDQCVYGTLLDSYFKGYDTVFVDDISATISPEYAAQMVRYNSDLNGFVSNSSLIIPALS
ncbi:Isochorismatase hydrolase [Periconia macrospinosa]|uniref:Isochorismatase hydrolase n=1 Tax=Periconia macrospinosa TaxID=97972 RepID=A0A2V1DBN8_9PLEO|nr:Isochorismatase hydrolase [Periconia macrospinosa]